MFVRMAKGKLRYFFEFGVGTCFWADGEDTIRQFGLSPIEPERLALSPSMVEKIGKMVAWFETCLDEDYPVGPLVWEEEECDRFNLAAAALYRDVCSALADRFDVVNLQQEIVSDYLGKNPARETFVYGSFTVEIVDLRNIDEGEPGVHVQVTGAEGVHASLILQGGPCPVPFHSNMWIREEDRLLILVSETVYALQLPDVNVLWQSEADEFGCFGIYKIDGGYIVHGETEISRISTTGAKVWGFTGRDIFTSPNAEPGFKIENGMIEVYDWEEKKYRIDLDGNEIG